MSDIEITSMEERLDKALRADMPPERDPWFRIAVLERRERHLWTRRMRLAIAAVAVTSLAASAAFTAFANANSNWFYREPEIFLLALATLATTCLALLLAWLRQENAVRMFLSAWKERFWI